MKKFLLACCLFLGIAAASHAQGGGGRMRLNPEERAKQLQKQLTLSDEQTVKLTDIFKAQGLKMDSVRKASNGDRDAMRTAMMGMRKTNSEQVKAVLTKEQAEAYDKAEKERMDRMRQGGGNGGGGTPPPTTEN